MTMTAHSALERDPFQAARDGFDETLEWLRGSGAVDHTLLEEELGKRGREVLRRLYQAQFDELSKAEKSEAARTPIPEGTSVRTRSRQLETSFGRVCLYRLGYKVAARKTHYPLDERLNLPSEVYSHPLRRRIAEQARAVAWDGVVEHVDDTTGAHVPKRQAEQLTREAAKDFDAFYTQRPANDTLAAGALLVASSDGKGVRMLPKALREATRKAAEADRAAAVHGDPMAKKKPRLHDKRMAIVTAVWEQQPQPRAASDIVSELQRARERSKVRKPSLPRPQNKRISASVQKNLSTGVGEMFDELDRRDPERARGAVVLIDGDEHQQTAILHQGQSRGRKLTIVLDLIHMIHYLWLAGFALCHKNHAKTDAWVARHLLLVLSRPVADLLTAIQAAADAQHLSKGARKPIDKALKYFRRNAAFMGYSTFLAQGLPIASGVIEGACRHLIQDRLGITGARWDLPGAEAVLRLRALHTSGDWDAYWRFHQRQEALRNYPSVSTAA
jgi:translation initiation factor 2 beta subunit (eIF-2beta)/eIF-5